MIDYFLAEDSPEPVTLEIKDKTGNLVRRYSSTDKPVQPDLTKAKDPALLDPPVAIALH